MIRQFTSIFGASWLQGRELLPLLEAYGAKVSGTVIDLGCGHSPFRRYFTHATRYVRMDLFPVDDEVIVADATNIPADSGSVDAILLGRMLGDIPDLPAAFAEFERVLAPDGKILIYESMSYPQHDLPHDYWRVMPNGLRRLATSAGLDVEHMQNLGGYFTQIGMHWNQFLLAPLGHYRALKPLASALRGVGNLTCRALDRLCPRADLASDYFACLIKPCR